MAVDLNQGPLSRSAPTQPPALDTGAPIAVPGSGSFTIAVPNGATSALLVNESPNYLQVQASGSSKWLAAWSADVIPLDGHTSQIVCTVQLIGSSNAPSSSLIPTFAFSGDQIPGSYPAQLVREAQAFVSNQGSYRDVILGTQPTAYWRLDETSGTIAYDKTGNGWNLNYVGTVELGQPGLLTGDPDYGIATPAGGGADSAGLPFPTWGGAQLFSFAVLFEVDASSPEGGLIGARTNTEGVEIAVFPSGSEWMLEYRSGLYGWTAFGPLFAAGTEHRLYVTWDGTALKVYLDGVLVLTDTSANVPPPAATDFYLGAQSVDMTTADYLGVDEGVFWLYPLSADQVAAIDSASQAPANAPVPVAVTQDVTVLPGVDPWPVGGTVTADQGAAGATPWPTTDSNDGAAGTGISPPTGGSGILGFLSGIYRQLLGTLTVAISGTPTVDVGNFPATQPVSGNVTAAQGAAGATPWPVTDSNDGAAGTGISPPTGGSGILGFLSGIYAALIAVLKTQDAADAAPGAAPPGIAIQVGGSDGGALRALKVDSTGRVILQQSVTDGAAIGGTDYALLVAGADTGNTARVLASATDRSLYTIARSSAIGSSGFTDTAGSWQNVLGANANRRVLWCLNNTDGTVTLNTQGAGQAPIIGIAPGAFLVLSGSECPNTAIWAYLASAAIASPAWAPQSAGFLIVQY